MAIYSMISRIDTDTINCTLHIEYEKSCIFHSSICYLFNIDCPKVFHASDGIPVDLSPFQTGSLWDSLSFMFLYVRANFESIAFQLYPYSF